MAASCPTEVETEPIPSKCPGWYVGAGGGRQAGFTSNPEYAARRPVAEDKPLAHYEVKRDGEVIEHHKPGAPEVVEQAGGFRVKHGDRVSRFVFPGKALALAAIEHDAVLGWVPDLHSESGDGNVRNVNTESNRKGVEMTAKGKIVTAQVTEGTTLLLAQDGDRLMVAHRKTGAVVATVESVETVAAHGGSGKRQSRYVFNTDKGKTRSFAPSQTHWLAKVEDKPEPVEAPEPRITGKPSRELVDALADEQARENFRHLAENANTESARAFWLAKAEG